MKDDKDLTFETPSIVDYGELTQLTATQATGANVDAVFPIGTPLSDLTLSN